MSSTTTPPTIEQILAHQQEQIDQLTHLLNQNQNAQPSAEQPTLSSNDQHTQVMDEDELVNNLHSLEIRPTYPWQPSAMLSELMHFEQSLFTTAPLPEQQRKDLIEKYPGMNNTIYNPPDTIPDAIRAMNAGQQRHDRSLKRLQYLTSGTVRPLDVLALEISRDFSNPNVQRYLQMLADCRLLILNLSSEITEMRKNLAFQAINPKFSSSSVSSSSNYIMPLDEFQRALSQQTTNLEAVQKASRFGKKLRPNSTNQQLGPHAQHLQFFRSGPSSQQGGYTNRHKYNSNNNSSTYSTKKGTNLFRQQH
ncbi:hypothetical protein RO3G_07101 [Rhizopus delemar RA 99-880]|uniref:Uncharacterized protein n=1 Tax=Rhizopus delemar (strain RA 99-880 / ATCC MYA-4621 / FGSC 9543 / NRRL 43880) TaxID=246409 RepID=I1C1R6_RHIO9|nr:hypothetical protein RO3G_07101 [Rhizopus delemar RA 99-880]|eukprot:EIE82396.1 hypothetical protein RO3G_07101 [Rhizopus delemar RA 99-880]